MTDPALTRLGPDPLKPNFSYEEAKRRYNARLKMKLADLLLDQTFVAGIGNKYKSELLFLCRLNPLISAGRISTEQRDLLIKRIPGILKIGYENAGRTRTLLDGEEQNKWNFRHWVFRVQVGHAGFAGLQSSLTQLKVLVYHFGVLIVRKRLPWIMQKRKANLEKHWNI